MLTCTAAAQALFRNSRQRRGLCAAAAPRQPAERQASPTAPLLARGRGDARACFGSGARWRSTTMIVMAPATSSICVA